MPIVYKVMPYDGTPQHEDEFNRMKEGPGIIFEITLPLAPQELFGDCLLFMHDGQWWIKTAQMVNHNNALIGFPPYFLCACLVASIDDEIRHVHDREAGLVLVTHKLEVMRLV